VLTSSKLLPWHVAQIVRTTLTLQGFALLFPWTVATALYCQALEDAEKAF
jgi:hypothetical protein